MFFVLLNFVLVRLLVQRLTYSICVSQMLLMKIRLNTQEGMDLCRNRTRALNNVVTTVVPTTRLT